MQAENATAVALRDGVFAALDPALRARLEAVQRVHAHPAGHVFCAEGDPVPGVTRILEGSAKIVREGEGGDPQVLRLLGKGDFFGLRPVLARQPFAASVVALEPCRVAVHSPEVVQALLRESPAFAAAVMAYLAHEWCYSEDMLMVLTRRPVRRRIADILLLLNGHRVPGDEWLPFPPVRLKRKEIAQLVGTTPETLSRTLAEFAKSGLIRLDRRNLEIIDAAALGRIDRRPDPELHI